MVASKSQLFSKASQHTWALIESYEAVQWNWGHGDMLENDAKHIYQIADIIEAKVS
jgi:hypothetical protein